jgi:hypothetical protein
VRAGSAAFRILALAAVRALRAAERLRSAALTDLIEAGLGWSTPQHQDMSKPAAFSLVATHRLALKGENSMLVIMM